MPELEAADGNAEQRPLRGVLPAGTTLRGYELVSILGQGAFGITYRARDLTLGRDVAIKEYLPATLALREGRTTVLPRSPDHAEQFAWGRERFLDEARTLARIDCPAIVRVYDFLEDNGTAYMVMALVEGETLNKRLMREQRLGSEAVERLLFPLLEGLEGVHAIGFLHRDIKPANLMVDDQGRPTLIDFGAARTAMAGRSTTMTAIFTPGYAAPEQFITAGKLGPWSDIYGVAATLYNAITGQIPPSGIDRIVDDAYEPLSDLRPEGFAPELLAGIDAGMAVRAADRPQSIAEWRQVLRSHSAAMEMTRIARKPGPMARAARGTRKAGTSLKGPAVSGAVAAALILLAGGGYLAFTANAPPAGSAAMLNLSTEQLEQVLAERRKADALVVEKRRLEEEARQRVETDAEAKRQADAQLAQVRQALQRAEQELATIKTDMEARRQPVSGQADQAGAAQRAEEEATQRKAETETAALREAEQEAARKAEADAEAKRQAEQALAVAEAQRKQAEAEALAKAETEAAARRQASEEEQRKAEAEAASRRLADEAQAKAQAEREKVEAEAKIKADAKAEADKAAATMAKLKTEGEAAERGLRLEQPERQRLQVALTSLGFDTRGTDGVLGPRSREMIAGWQKARNQPATGFLNAAQQQALLKEATAAVTKFDDEQRKAEEEKKKAEEAKVAAATPPPSALAPSQVATLPTTAAYDGIYSGAVPISHGGGAAIRLIRIEVRNGKGSVLLNVPGCAGQSFPITISSMGNVTGSGFILMAGSCARGSNAEFSGRVAGGEMQLNITGNNIRLTRSADDVAATAQPAGPFDGTYSGRIPSGGSAITVTAIVANGRGEGALTRAGCDRQSFTFTVSTDGTVNGSGNLNCPLTGNAGGITPGDISITGNVTDRSLQIHFYSYRGSLASTLRLGN
jgi:peptidoglycan hydrolase-like protein with peptidoglycan-binding domain